MGSFILGVLKIDMDPDGSILPDVVDGNVDVHDVPLIGFQGNGDVILFHVGIREGSEGEGDGLCSVHPYIYILVEIPGMGNGDREILVIGRLGGGLGVLGEGNVPDPTIPVGHEG